MKEDASVNIKRNKRGKISSANIDEDNLEERKNNKTDEHISTEKVMVEDSAYVRTMS